MDIKTLADVIKFVNEYWKICWWLKWSETKVGKEAIEKLSKMGDITYWYEDGTLTSSGDF